MEARRVIRVAIVLPVVVTLLLRMVTPMLANPSGDEYLSNAETFMPLLRSPVPQSLRLTVPLDAHGNFLRTDYGDSMVDPAIIDLTASGFAPGDLLRLSYTG